MEIKGGIYAALMALIMVIALLPICAFAEDDLPAVSTDAISENEVPETRADSTSNPGELPESGEDKAQIDIQVMSDINDTIHAEDMLTIDAASDDSVSDIKAMIQTETGLLPQRQVLFFNEKSLKDEQLLSDCGISAGSVLRLGVRVEQYTVTLGPGSGSGTPVVYRITEQADIPDKEDAESGQFYYIDDDSADGCVGFCLDELSCPDTFSAPDGASFDGWDAPDKAYYTFSYDSAAEVTFTAKWKAAETDSDPQSPALRGDPEAWVEVSTWNELYRTLVFSGWSQVKLTADVTPSSESNHLWVNRDFVIDLNGHTIDAKGAFEWVSIIEVSKSPSYNTPSTLTIMDTSRNKTGKITGGISNTEEDGYGGGGIFLGRKATLVMKGGTITGNTSNKGGGVYVSNHQGEAATFKMYGGTITGNTAKEGGGVYVEDGATFIATGGTITENTATSKEGGGIKNKGATSLTDCIVSNNSAKLDGGGIYSEKELTIDGGEFNNNNATNRGGGIYIHKSAAFSKIKGIITVTGNTADMGKDLYLREGQKLTLTGQLYTTLSNKTNIGSIEMEQFGTFTENYSVFEGSADPRRFFCTDGDAFPISLTDDQKEARLESNWSGLQRLITEAGNNPNDHTITLGQDYTACPGDDRLKVKGTVTIDLNGYTINRHLFSHKKDGHVLEVYDGGKLTITNDRADKNGRITGGWPDNGGGIYVNESASLAVEGGTITGNHASKSGGGIYVLGHLTMNGGSVKSNQAGDNGGGICLAENGKLDITNSQITGNRANGYGGGINISRIKQKAASRIIRCLISGNHAGKNGGGIHIADMAGSTEIGNGTQIDNNTANNDGGGIFLQMGSVRMSGGSISKNEASRNSGGVKVAADLETNSFSANAVTFDRNIAISGEGGAIKNFGKTTLTDCTVTNNSAMLEGGGVYNNNYKNVTPEEDSYFSRITHKSPGELTLNACTINGNYTESNGAGVYSSCKLDIISGTISTNSATGKGGGVFIGSDAESVGIEGTLNITGNAASVTADDVFLRSGKKFTCTDSLAGGAKIGIDLEDGVGTFTKSYKSKNGTTAPSKYFIVTEGYDLIQNKDGEAEICSEWSAIKARIESTPAAPVVLDRDYAAGPEDRPIVIPSGKSVTVDLNGNTLNRNLKAPLQDPDYGGVGGSVFRVEGTLNLKDSHAPNGTVTGGCAVYGGGIYIAKRGTLNLQSGTVSGNRVSVPSIFYSTSLGGGICVDGTLNMTGGIIRDNLADNDGGGICVRKDGTLNLTGGIVDANKADKNGGGILVQKGAKVNISGGPVVSGNKAAAHGHDVYLIKESKLTVSGAFSPGNSSGGTGALIGISAEDDDAVYNEGYVFTTGYHANNLTKDPATVFSSSDGYMVLLRDDEAVLLSNTYGETEYEYPFIDRDHQIHTDTASLTGRNWMSGISGERYLNEINMPGSHDAGMHDLTVIKAPVKDISERFAKTQTRYIEQQLEEGSRQLDVRLTLYYDYRTVIDTFLDDRKNLWLCHGNTWIGGTCLALDRNGDKLSLEKLLGTVKEFLRKNPTETVILDLRPELGDWGTIYDRCRMILEDHALEINPSTGEPYLYKESGSDSYFATYTQMPQLKDCRGKIVLLPNSGGFRKRVGGLDAEGMVGSYFFGGSEYGQLSGPHASSLLEEYNKQNPGLNSTQLPTTAGGSWQDYLWYWQLNCTGEDEKYETYVKESNTPIRNASYVNRRLIGDTEIFGPQTNGQYIGWVRMDAFEGKYAEPIWRTNFGDAEYCTITVDSGLNNPKYATQGYHVLKGTKIEIPGNIYKNPDGDLDGKYLAAWEAVDENQNVIGTYYPGDTLDTTAKGVINFRAKWLEGEEIPVSIVWKDADDYDRLRPEKVSLTVKYSGGTADRAVELESAKGWQGSVTGDVDTVVPDWDKIDTSEGSGYGKDGANNYRYEINGSKDSGFVLTFYHTPDKKVKIGGDVVWNDESNADKLRPSAVSIKLIADGRDTDQTVEATSASADDTWTYSFGDQPAYKNGETIQYSVSENTVAKYSTSVDGFRIINTHYPDKPPATQVFGIVEWDDGCDKQGKRPERITVRLLANDVVQSRKEVSSSHGFKDFWTFSFDELPANDAQGNPIRYSIEVDAVPDYIDPTVEKTGEDAGISFRVSYVLDVPDDEKEPATIDPPKANTLTYNGEEQELVTAGSCSGGTLMYALGENASTAPDDADFKTQLPTGKKAGVYYVWYYGKGDVFHTDTEKECVSVEIRKIPATSSTISYDLNGGTLDGKTGTVKISAENGTTITLPAPTREGYAFDYWEGSRYNAGDSYTVNGDHTFTAQWKKNENPDPADPDNPDNPNDPNNSKDNGGTNTGDESHILLWLTLMTLSMLGLTITALTRRRHN